MPGVGAGALALLQSPPSPTEAVLAALLNDLSAVPDDMVLVLDDYHVIESVDLQDGVAFLLEHLPPQIHLVIATRADPALPLARLRARASWSRSAPPICASPPTRRPRTSTASWD